MTRLHERLAPVSDAVRTQLWPLPALSVTLALLAGVGVPRLDARVDDALPGQVEAYLFGGGAEAARAVLGAIASSLITVTSLTFSLTVVTLQLASSQFSPRLLRTFTRDRFVHATLALFLATFTFALTVLRTVRTRTDVDAEFIPQISVTLAFLLAVASVLGLVLFLAHLAREIRVETMLQTVHVEATQTARRVLAEEGVERSAAVVPSAPAAVELVLAAESGFLARVDADALLEVATQAGVTFRLDRMPGSSVVAGTPVGALWPDPGLVLDDERRHDLHARITGTCVVGFERTSVQDVGFGLRQLVDVATKALSPGINDPTTAIHALGHCSALLCELCDLELGPRVLREASGRVRVVLAGPQLRDLLDLVVAQPRRYGASDPAVLGRLFELLAEVGWCARRSDQRHDVLGQLHRLRRTAAAQDLDETERAGLARRAEQVEQALQGRWPDPGAPA